MAPRRPWWRRLFARAAARQSNPRLSDYECSVLIEANVAAALSAASIARLLEEDGRLHLNA